MDTWVLREAKVATGPGEPESLDLEIRDGKISKLRRPGRSSLKAREIDLEGCLILPGLINAHDHLEYSLFPRLGNGPYPSAKAWALDIHHPERSPIKEHLRLSLPVRLRWGGIKNLLSGATTVCHHNPYHARVFDNGFPVKVLKRYGWAHSLDFAPHPASSFRRTPRDWPFVVHVAESHGREGSREVLDLCGMGALDGRTVLVHGVGLRGTGLRLAVERGASLVWCPSSNLFILGQTISREVVDSGIPIALGTDSGLSGEGDILDEMRRARRSRKISIGRLFEMVTKDSARLLRLRDGEGVLSEGAAADILAIRYYGGDAGSALLKLRAGEMELVLVGGRLKLISRRLLRRISCPPGRLHPLIVENKREVLLEADLPGLFRETARVLGPDIRLAGKRIRMG